MVKASVRIDGNVCPVCWDVSKVLPIPYVSAQLDDVCFRFLTFGACKNGQCIAILVLLEVYSTYFDSLILQLFAMAIPFYFYELLSSRVLPSFLQIAVTIRFWEGADTLSVEIAYVY